MIELLSLSPWFLQLFPPAHFVLLKTLEYFCFVPKSAHVFAEDEAEFFGSKEEEEIHGLEYSSPRFGYFD